MPRITGRDVHIDRALSNLSIGYHNEGYIADRVFPLVPVEKQSDNYFIWTKDHWFRNYVQRRAPGDNFPEGGLELSTASYFCNMFHLSYPLNDEEVANEDEAVSQEEAGSDWLADQFMLNREASIVADFFKTGVWDTDKTLSGTGQWSDFANSDPIDDINVGKQTIQKNTGTLPNKLVIGQEVLDKLSEHPQLLDKFKHTAVGILSPDQVRQALQVMELLIGAAVENTAKEGATYNGGYMWGKKGLLIRVPPTAGRRIPSAGYTFTWNIEGLGLTTVVERIREENRKRTLLAARNAYDQKATGTDLGYFLETVIA